VGALIERVLHDPSPRVRRVAVHQLGLQPHDARTVETLTRVIAESTDARVVSRARQALGLQQAPARSSAARGSRAAS
jgi:HEAT repeat protein